MTKIIIPERKTVQTYREFDIEEGELILLLNGKRVDEKGLVKSAILGVFGGIIEEDNSEFRMKYGPRYYDKKYLKILSPNKLEPISGYGQTFCVLSKSQGHRRFWITKQIKQIYSPQEQIVEALRSMPGFQAHAEWISKLTKPYLREN